MPTEQELIEVAAEQQKAAQALLARRRLLKGGLGAAPILATVVSRPVHAGECMSASAWTSVTRSGPQHNNYSCDGGTPDYWSRQPTTDWPIAATTPFHSMNGGLFSGNVFGTATLQQVMSNTSGGLVVQVGRYVAAARLNAMKGWTNALTVAQVHKIWDDYVLTGYGQYSPTPGVVWDSAQITAWIDTTMSRA